MERKTQIYPYAMNYERLKNPPVGLISAAILDSETSQFLRLGYMDKDAYLKTIQTGEIRLWSPRWQERSGLYLAREIIPGCEKDSLLIYAGKSRNTWLNFFTLDINQLDFSKFKDLPIGIFGTSIINTTSGKYLMTGYMSEESYRRTLELGKIVFYSRAKKEEWLKGETSGNFLNVKEIVRNSDYTGLTICVDPVGPTCHRGTESCFDAKPVSLGQT